MEWIILIIAVVVIRFFYNFFQSAKTDYKVAFNSIPEGIQLLIMREDVLELAALITDLELKGDYRKGKQILEACQHRGLSFVNRVDRARNEMRIKLGLGELKNF